MWSDPLFLKAMKVMDSCQTEEQRVVAAEYVRRAFLKTVERETGSKTARFWASQFGWDVISPRSRRCAS